MIGKAKDEIARNEKAVIGQARDAITRNEKAVLGKVRDGIARNQKAVTRDALFQSGVFLNIDLMLADPGGKTCCLGS